VTYLSTRLLLESIQNDDPASSLGIELAKLGYVVALYIERAFKFERVHLVARLRHCPCSVLWSHVFE
jgi:hypothetical protein